MLNSFDELGNSLSPSPLVGEGWGGGSVSPIAPLITPHPIPPPQGGRRQFTIPLIAVMSWLGFVGQIIAGPLPPKQPPVTALAYSNDGKTLAAGMNRSVVLFELKSGEVTKRIETPGQVTAAAFVSDKQLIIATGHPGQSGELHVHDLKSNNPPRIIRAHHDLIYGLSIRDGQVATGSYDRLVKLWNLADGKELFTLKDHSDSVYRVAFRPNGKLLASVAADRSLKIWDTTTGKRLYSLTEATDWLSTVAFSPDGKLVAAAGVDKSIRIYAVDETEGKLHSSFFAHDGTIFGLAFAPDGKSLFSLGQDRIVKVWDVTKGTELRHFAPLPTDALVMALRPDGKQLAIGRHDGVLTLHDVKNGKVTATSLPEKPKIALITPDFGPRGRSTDIHIIGERLDLITEIVASNNAATVKLGTITPTRIDATISLGAQLGPGPITLTAKSPIGDLTPIGFLVDLFPPANLSATGQSNLLLDRSYAGELIQSGAVSEFRLALDSYAEIGVVVTSPADSKLEPIIKWVNSRGEVSATGIRSLAITTHEATYGTLKVHDRDFRGGKHFGYRINIGRTPVVTANYPLGIERGQSIEVELAGVNLRSKRVQVTAPPDAAPGSQITINVPGVQPPPKLVVGEFPELSGIFKTLQVPGTANGRVKFPFLPALHRFPAKKGQRLVIEALAQRYGSPLDPSLEIVDENGKPVERARLQCVAKTVMTLRDHGPGNSAIRMENWNEFAVDDFVWIGQELVRISELPGHPDADCSYYALGGKRQTFMDTTPGWHPLGSAVYKVQFHPPNTALAPNGFPIVPIYYRNDDGGPGYGKDSRIIFDPPADGFYFARVTSAAGGHGEQFAYRLTVRPPKPDFAIKAEIRDPKVETGGASAISVTADRIDGFDGPIMLRMDGLPDGFTCPPTVIEASQTKATLALAADNIAKSPETGELKLVATAEIDGKVIEHSISIGRPKVVEPGDLITRLEQNEVTLRPGQESHLKVRIERRNDFKGRVPMEVRGLPHGVRVLHIGLNGIMITEKETTRTIVLGAEPWVKEKTMPIIVVGQIEGKNSEHAAPPIHLRIAK